jgi:hypothetical protein
MHVSVLPNAKEKLTILIALTTQKVDKESVFSSVWIKLDYIGISAEL